MEPVGVESPERSEGSGVDPQDTLGVPAPGPLGAPSVVREPGGGRKVLAQSGEFRSNAETVGDEPVACQRGDRSGNDCLIPETLEPVAYGGQHRGREGWRGSDGGQIRDVVATLPGPDAKSGRADPYRGQRHGPAPRPAHILINGCPIRSVLFNQEAPGTIRTVLVITDERFLDHDTGFRHPERPDRLRAALAGVTAVDAELLSDSCAPRRAERSELELVHRPEMIDRVVTLAEHGGGRLDADTPMGAASLDAALLAAGAVLSAAEQLGAGSSEAEAYCIVRPPGHHATPEASMGFCLFNSVAVAAASLAATGQRVAVVDVDAHHGNGTQDVFFHRDDVLYASIHQYPLYPGTGALAERGAGPGEGSTINVPLPPGATGEAARAALDEAIIPVVEGFAPDWLLISAGYDGHRADPLTGLCYSSSDYGDFVRRLMPLAPRTVAVLEGGYDLEATRASSYAVAGALLGLDLRPEPASSAGPGMEVVRAAARLAACDDPHSR